MRITIVLPFVNLTGGIRVLLDYANWLHDDGHTVTVVYPSWPPKFQFGHRAQWREFHRQCRVAPQIPWFNLRCRLRRVPFIATRFLPQADVVAATSWPMVWAMARLGPSCGRKVHVLFHHEAGTGNDQRVRSTYELPLYRVTCAPFVRDSIVERFGCEIQEIVPCGIDGSLFFPDGQPSEDTVLMLYHNDPRKGAADAIQALTLVRRRLPWVRARASGTVQPAQLPPWVEFEHHVTDARLRRLYSTSAVFLYPSRDEGFGLPPLESMACGCPVVTTPVGAIPEFAIDRGNALVVPVGASDRMAEAIEELLASRALRSSLSAAGVLTAAEYSVAKTAPLFRDALSRAH